MTTLSIARLDFFHETLLCRIETCMTTRQLKCWKCTINLPAHIKGQRTMETEVLLLLNSLMTLQQWIIDQNYEYSCSYCCLLLVSAVYVPLNISAVYVPLNTSAVYVPLNTSAIYVPLNISADYMLVWGNAAKFPAVYCIAQPRMYCIVQLYCACMCIVQW